LLPKIIIQVDPKIYLKDPESSSLGRKIVGGSIELISKMGLECFTFKKLAEEINSTEASIYRYFENKHRILLYLCNWYWSLTEYQLVFLTTNVESAEERLLRIINLLTNKIVGDDSFEHIREQQLRQIVFSESVKAFLTKEVDVEDKEGAFISYKSLVERTSKLILEINPSYGYPHMLVSAIIEGAHILHHFADHMPYLTNNIRDENSVTEFYEQIVFKAIK